MIRFKKTGQWRLLEANIAALSRAKVIQHLVVQQEAQHFRAKVIEAFDSSGKSNGKSWEPLKAGTIEKKESSKPLINRGDLRNSIVAKPAGRNRAFVGVSSKARSKDGSRMVDIAAVHEFGRTIAIRVTKRMFNYFMAQVARSGKGARKGSGKFRPGSVLIIKIPQRSFLRATAEAHFTTKKAFPRLMARYATLLKLRGGKSVANLPKFVSSQL